MSRHYSSENELRSKISETIKDVSRIVTSTLGPEGKTVLLRNKENKPFVTKDGVTVSRFIKYEDPIKDAIAQTIRQAAEETNTKCGDGTTTTTLLVEAIYSEALKHITTGTSPYVVKRGIDMAVSDVLYHLDKESQPIKSLDDIRNIATISANNDVSIGTLLSNAIDMIGKDGSITIEEARSLDTSLSIVEGYKFDSGYASPQFITHPSTALCKLDDCYLLILEDKIEDLKQYTKVLEMVARDSKPLVIICEDYSQEAMAYLIVNALRSTGGSLKNVVIKSPKYGEERKNILKDLAIATGATYIDRVSGILPKDITLEHLGRCKSVEVAKNETIISDPKGSMEQINERIEMLRSMIKMETNDAEIQRLQERITRLTSGVAIIKVGGATEAEVTEKRHRIEDALNAVRTAIDSGISVGGGVSLLRASKNINDSEEGKFGIDVIRKALRKPILQMAENASMNGDYIIGKIEEIHNTGLNEFGYDFSSKSYCDLKANGIIDPTLVLKLALQNAVSAAMVLLMSNHAIVEV